jgi:hypothetical protein
MLLELTVRAEQSRTPDVMMPFRLIPLSKHSLDGRCLSISDTRMKHDATFGRLFCIACHQLVTRGCFGQPIHGDISDAACVMRHHAIP